MKKFLSTLTAVLFLAVSHAAVNDANLYNAKQCEGSLTPYPTEVDLVAYPDSLTPKYVSHVGRHGSRYPASAAHCNKLREALQKASEIGTITALGKDLLALTDKIIAVSTNRWGALDSLGQAEQRAIATRLMNSYPSVFADGAHVNALCSYSPRCMMSMFSFVHQMDRLNNKLEFSTGTGRKYSYLMRPFDTDRDYLEFRDTEQWKNPYDEYFDEACPLTAITRVLGRDFPFGETKDARDLAITEYYVIAGLQAMEMESEMKKYFTTDEMNALWSCFNLRQYLQRTASTVSSVPADIASALVLDIVSKADAAVEGVNPVVADLRFGHAETVMPLLSLLRIPGCYYLTNYFDTVSAHWCDFDVVPMAANIQFILFQNVRNGKWYVRVEHNEQPVSLIPGDSRLIIPWGEARRYMMDCIPIYAQ